MQPIFGHLKPHEFVDLMEGGRLGAKRHAHLGSCALCQTKLQSHRILGADLLFPDENIPEPDWNEFRSSVRLGLLSRAVKRESAIRRWTGWPIRPAIAWSLGFLFVISVSVSGFLMHVSNDATGIQSEVAEEQPVESAVLPTETDEVTPAWTTTSLFAEAAQLDSEEVGRLQKLLESAEKETVQRQ